MLMSLTQEIWLMTNSSKDQPVQAPLNPALKSTTETSHDTDTSSEAPFDTASAKEGEGEGWPVIWLVVTILGVLLAIWFLA